jgi:hypothetical protein
MGEDVCVLDESDAESKASLDAKKAWLRTSTLDCET